jgi:hypothetical protein
MSIVSVAERALIPAAIAIVFAVSRRYLPPPSTVAVSQQEADEFSRLQWAVGLAMVIVGGVFGYCSYKALAWTNSYLAFHGENARFTLLPGPWTWGFLPFFGVLCLAWEMTLRLWKLVGDPLRVLKYEIWSNTKSGFNATRVLRIFALTIELPIAIATVLALPIHTSIDDMGIEIGHFGALQPARRVYSEVRSITVVDGLRLRDGSIQRRPAIVLEFSDGTRWSSSDNRDPQKSIDQDLLDFLQEETRLPAEELDAFPFGTH